MMHDCAILAGAIAFSAAMVSPSLVLTNQSLVVDMKAQEFTTDTRFQIFGIKGNTERFICGVNHLNPQRLSEVLICFGCTLSLELLSKC